MAAPVAPTPLPVAVIGAGPVGLAAAAHLAERGIRFVVLEAGDGPAASVAQWGHVRLFSPWRYDVDAASSRLLHAAGWSAPDPERLPTGAELIRDYLQPLGQLPALAPHLRYRSSVEGITRVGVDRVRSVGREQAPFLLRLGDGSDVIARAVIDASGTWRTPNVLGAGGLPAVGEPAGATRGGAGGAAAHLEPALPDVLGADRERFAGRHTLVVGSGHSAANTLLALAALRADAPGTRVTWAVRGPAPTRAYGGGDADQLPARGALGSTLRELVASGDVELLAGFRTRALIPAGGRVEVVGEDGESAPGRGGRGADRGAGDGPRVVVDRVVVATGYRPDHALAAELRLDVDPVLGATRALAPLIDPNEHSCGTVPPHGVDELAHPEQDYWVVGAKAYGRAPTFLLATGYEQVRSVTAELAGDRAAAREVRLILPQTGVCSSDRPTEAAGDCCSAPAPTFATVVAAAPGGGCCT